MGLSPPEFYWTKNNHRYPHQCKVKHFSEQDIDPREVQQLVTFHFLRVPFNGEAHWGFKEEQHLNRFLEIIRQK
jgi:hypothetical protein